jgi:alpha-L-rhamnosidase
MNKSLENIQPLHGYVSLLHHFTPGYTRRNSHSIAHPLNWMILLPFLLTLILVSGCEKPSMLITGLKVENMSGPVNLDVRTPALSWRLMPTKENSRNLSQRSWQVMVASSLELLRKDKPDLWNSGIMDSSAVMQVIYAGKKLHSRQQCFWKVRISDQDNKLSEWSETASFTMALLDKSDWKGAQWIGLKDDTCTSPLRSRSFLTFTMKLPEMRTSHPSPIFRKQFRVSGKISRAMAYVSGLGYNELYVNGEKSGENVLDPGQTNYDVRAFYVTHDITGMLKKGENAIGVMLGNGFYGQSIAFVDWLNYGTPRLKCKIWIEYKNGEKDSLVTGIDWKASTGAVLFNNVYGGESYDARLEKEGWNKTGYDDASWQSAVVVDAPTDSLCSQMIPPIKRMKTLIPVKIFPASGGKWIVDMGQNLAGWARIRVKEKEGQQITMRFAENLDSTGRALDFASLGHQHTGMIQTNIYVCKSSYWEEWEPRFTYAGFRYVEITGLSSKPDSTMIRGVLVRTSVERTGHFTSSDTLMNQIYQTSLWTIEDNLHSIPEDCPAREKCGWLGDAHGTAETDLYNYDMANFFAKYMADIESQLGRGGETYLGEPATAGIPGNISTGKRICQEARVDWGVAVILVPYDLYLFNGDIRVFAHWYPHMKDFINYIIRYEDKKGIIQNGYGDWCPPGGNEKMECPPQLTSTAFFYGTLSILSDMAAKLGDAEYSKWCAEKMANVKDHFNEAYLRQIPGTSGWTYGSQTGIVMAYRMGLIPDDKKTAVSEGLVYDIKNLHGGHISTGIHGQRIYSVLCDMGLEELAYSVLTTPTYPSLAYTLAADLTTWPETPEKYQDKSLPRTGSMNHPMNSGFAAFFHECIGGIRPVADAPGFKNFVIKPSFIYQLQWANTDMESSFGQIVSNWKKDKDAYSLDVTIPCNTSAVVYIPSGVDPDGVSESGVPISKNTDLKVIGHENGRTIVKVGSGVYHFKSRI